MIENVLIVDTETTGLEPSKGAKLIEIAAILYNVKHRTILQQFSTLLPCDENPVENINNISAESTRVKMPLTLMVPLLTQMADHAQAWVAHNAQFDKKFIATIEPQPAIRFTDRKWICTKADFRWPVQLYRTRLEDVCTAMGVAYVDAHRALTDCDFIAKCFTKVADLENRLMGARHNSFANSGKYR